MPKSYTQIYTQFVFAVKYRENLLKPQYNDELHRYIGGIIRNCDSTMLSINNMPDHFHILVSRHPSWSESKLIQTIKANSSRFIKQQQGLLNFSWQVGYGAFSYSRSQLGALTEYIKNQQKHHSTQSFRAEYIDTLQRFGLEYEEADLFEFYD